MIVSFREPFAALDVFTVDKATCQLNDLCKHSGGYLDLLLIPDCFSYVIRNGRNYCTDNSS